MMDFGALTSVFNVLSGYTHPLFAYLIGILFVWSVSLTIDFCHLKRLSNRLNTKAKHNPDLPTLVVLLLTLITNIGLAFYVVLVPHHLALELIIGVQFWFFIGLLRTTEIIYKSLLFVAPTSKQVLRIYSWRYLFHP